MQHRRVVATTEAVADLRQAVLGELLGQGHRHLARARQRAGPALGQEIGHAQLVVVCHGLLDVGVEKKEEMPVLISAVSAQLTLGLDSFSLDYFRDIYVLKHDYHYGYYSLPFMGHVDSSGIYLSWDNFLQGIHRAADNSNVGLHEMAHALAYVNFITKTEQDKHFSTEFRNYSEVARPIFMEMQKGRKTLLGEYAATNYHEFWAVSVEMFFENPFRFKYELPDLYAAMVKLLKQDPYELIVNRRADAVA